MVEDLEPRLSLVMPAYNEADVIGDAVSRADLAMAKTRMAYEIIVVDDGSVDGTRQIAENHAQGNGHVRVVGYNRNLGKGYALKTGFAHARGDTVVFVDSDLDVDPCQIIQYVRALEHNDIAVASKWHPRSSVEIPLARSVLSHGFNVLVKLLTGIKLKDTQTGLKAVKRRPLENVFSRLSVKRFAFDVELLVAANLYGLKVVELPVKIQMRGLFSIREVWRMFLDVLGITYRLRVLKWYRRAMKKSL
jgi:glycosyltransferase involved in cell wall biosynthesis